MAAVMFKVTAKASHERDRKKLEEFVRGAAERSGGRLVCFHSTGGNVAYGLTEYPSPVDYAWQAELLDALKEIAEDIISLIVG
jgi:hypothetical protein